MIQVQKGFTPRFGALPSEPEGSGSTSLQRSQRVRSMDMDEVIRVKAKVVTSEGDLGRFWGGKIWKNLGKSWKNGTCHGKLMRTNLEHVMENVEIDAEKWLDKWRWNGKISHGKCVMDFFLISLGCHVGLKGLIQCKLLVMWCPKFRLLGWFIEVCFFFPMKPSNGYVRTTYQIGPVGSSIKKTI